MNYKVWTDDNDKISAGAAKRRFLNYPAGFLLLTAILAIIAYGCNRKLNVQPQGSLLQTSITNLSGVNGLLIGAYAVLDGENVPVAGDAYGSAGSNWVYGSICADDSYKGSVPSDQPDATALESWTLSQGGTTTYLNEKWTILYLGIQRANDVLRNMRLATGISPADTAEISGEARFLRGYYHMDGRKIFHFFPYVDETISFVNNNLDVPNNADIWPQITADLLYAVNHLPETQPQAGRVNKWAAMAFLAKDYMFQHNYDSANYYLKQVIASGVTAQGVKYALVNFQSNFNAPQKNSPESVFACQSSVNDGSASANDGGNGSMGDVLNFPDGVGAPVGCCGFNDPSWNLANAYKTDANGLPLLDGSFNSGKTVSDSANLYTGPVDPRIDWTMSRPGIPYLDWGIASASWVRDPNSNGIFEPKKTVYAKSQAGTYSSTETVFWGATQITALNTNLMRYSDVLLMAAECEVETGSLDQAETYVNMVRNRAADPSGWVYKNDTYDPASGQYKNKTTPADNYLVKPYATGAFTSNGQDYARNAVHFERRLELAMEGHRFFDLQRWDNGTGSMAATLNTYVATEKARHSFYYVVNTAFFTKGVNEYFAIPQQQIDLENATGTIYLKQNPGYN
ncbi:MAG TPA: RagB/SusD family nutrient uptake outer membrane protein [Puia sp.]|nr:RagB/SusD family nutrient uptake outer membrane protein [Puia sp.]